MRRADHRRAPRRARAGSSAWQTVAALALAGGIAASAVVVTPRLIRAGDGDPLPAPVLPRDPERRAVAEAVASLLSRSVEVLAIHDRREASPLLEVVLWLEDGEAPGRLHERELAVLAHSRVLHTLTVSTLAAAAGRGAPLDVETLREAPFAHAWRTRDDVETRVIARGLSDLAVEPVPEAAPDQPAGSAARAARLRIRLTWAGKSADVPDEASILVDAAYDATRHVE